MNKFMKQAIEEAKRGIHHGHGGPFGAVIVKNGKILGAGHNEVVKNQDPTCHGEIMAIHDACKKLNSFDLSGCELYTTAEPCPMCLGAILWSNIRVVHYGCNIIDTEKIGFRDKVFYELNETGGKAQILHELDRDECRALFQEYSDIKDKINY